MNQQLNTITEMTTIRPHPLVSDVKKMLREYNLQWETPAVVANLTLMAEKMAIEILENAMAYGNKDAGEAPVTLDKSDIELAIKLMNQDEVKLPNEDAMIDAAVAVNGNPLIVKEMYGIPLPKNHLGNCNYQLQNSSDLMQMEEPINQTPFYTYIMPFDNYLPNNCENMENYMFNNGFSQQNQHHVNTLPIITTITSQGNESPSSMYDDIPPENYGYFYDE